MTFDLNKLTRAAPLANNQALFTYVSPDGLDTIEAAGYFNGAAKQLSDGDVIFISGAEVTIPYTVTSNDGSTVAVSSGVPSRAGLAAGDVAVGAGGITFGGSGPSLISRLAGSAASVVIAHIGDSRHANGILNAAPSFGRTNQSAMSWTEFLLFGRVRTPTAYNLAVGGSGTVDLDGQITNLLALSTRPTHCAILTGTNTINNASSATGLLTTMQAHFLAAWARLQLYGIIPIQVLDLPREWTTTTLTAAVKRNLHTALNIWLRQTAPQYGCLLIDPVWLLTDPSKTTGECLTSLYYTESPAIHPGPTGGYRVGLRYKELFEGMGLPPRYVGLGRGDAYDATNAPRGNLIPEGGTFATAGGTFSGANPPTGQVGLGWILRNDTGASSLVSCVGSLEARTDGPGNWQKVVATVDGSGPGATILLYNQTPFSLVAGDTVEFAMDVIFDASSVANQCAVSVQDRNTAGASVNRGQYAMQFGSVADIGAFQATFAGRAITDPLTLGSSFATLRYGISIQMNPSSTITFRIGAAELRKVL